MIGAAAVILTLFGAYLWVSMAAAPWKLAGGLLDSADHFQRAQKKLTAGFLKDARYETLAGVAAAERAHSGYASSSPLFDVATLHPKLAGLLGESDHLVQAARLSGRAAEGTLDIAQNALRGPEKIIVPDPEDPKGGARIRIDRVREITKTVSRIRRSITGVKRELDAIELKRIPRRLRPRVEDGVAQAKDTDVLLRKAEAGLTFLPRFLGAEEPRVYLFGMQNSAEQRGTGGAMLQFALLSISNGSPELSKEASTVYDVDENRDPVSIPLPADAWYVREIADAQRFGNANWSPDWPLSAQLTIDYARASEPTFPDEVHGVFAVTPIMMQKLLPGIGPYRIPSGNRISASKVINFVLYKAYASFPIPKIRRARLREVVDGFYERLLRPDHPADLVKGFGESLAEKHMQIWMADPAEQAFIEEMNWDGAIDPAAQGDYLYVVQQNVGGNKLNIFEEQEHRMDIRISKDGSASHDTTVKVRNEVFLPQPRWSMGDTGRPRVCRARGACPIHRPMINVYVPGAATLVSADYEGTLLNTAVEGLAAWSIGSTPDTTRPAEHTELDKKVWSSILEIAPREQGEVAFGYTVPDVVRRVGDRNVYRLLVQYQPKIHSEQLHIDLELPEGARDVRARGWQGRGLHRGWRGTVTKDMVLELSWRD